MERSLVGNIKIIVVPIVSVLLLIVGLVTIFYGIYRIIINKEKESGFQYLATGLGVVDVPIILTAFSKTGCSKVDNSIYILSVLAVLLLVIAFYIKFKSNK